MDTGAGQAALPKMAVRIEGLVRDRMGKPKIDGDPRKLPQSVIAAMTPAEFEVAIQEYEANATG